MSYLPIMYTLMTINNPYKSSLHCAYLQFDGHGI